MLQDEPIVPGDHVIVHVGYALQKLSAEHAQEVWDTYDLLLAHEDER
jgi:hydrogenase expression/formation protein HypC